MSIKRALIIISKAPKSRLEKSRLQMSSSAKAAFWRLCLQATVRKCRDLVDVDTIVSYYPRSAQEEMKAICGTEVQLYSADRLDFGEALKYSYHYCLAKGYDVVANIAPDSPDTPRDYLSRGLRMADTHDIVIGPSTDGGYYFLAIHGMKSKIFSDVSWGTEAVFAQMIENGHSLGFSLYVLPVWYDVDSLFQMKFLRDHLVGLRIAGQLPCYQEELVGFLERLGPL